MVYWDQDMAIEFISRGGRCVVCEKSFVTDEQGPDTSQLGMLAMANGDYACMLYMWIDNNSLRTQRREPIDPLVYNDTVLTKSQGRSLECWD